MRSAEPVVLDDLDRRLVDRLQDGLAVCEAPFAPIAAALGIDEAAVVARIERLLDTGVLTRFGPMFDAVRFGGAFTLAAMAVPAERFDAVAAQVNAHPEIAHNYARDHAFDMWFVVATEVPEHIAAVLAAIEAETGLPVFDFPKEREFAVRLRLAA